MKTSDQLADELAMKCAETLFRYWVAEPMSIPEKEEWVKRIKQTLPIKEWIELEELTAKFVIVDRNWMAGAIFKHERDEAREHLQALLSNLQFAKQKAGL